MCFLFHLPTNTERNSERIYLRVTPTEIESLGLLVFSRTRRRRQGPEQ
jgi:hypothetical protein